jgi:heme/copper-type cytochrome/quinol oxidase subunit 1
VSGIIQANYGLNFVLHNTQWIMGPHVHMMLLMGLSPIGFVFLLINRVQTLGFGTILKVIWPISAKAEVSK